MKKTAGALQISGQVRHCPDRVAIYFAMRASSEGAMDEGGNKKINDVGPWLKDWGSESWGHLEASATPTAGIGAILSKPISEQSFSRIGSQIRFGNLSACMKTAYKVKAGTAPFMSAARIELQWGSAIYFHPTFRSPPVARGVCLVSLYDPAADLEPQETHGIGYDVARMPSPTTSRI